MRNRGALRIVCSYLSLAALLLGPGSVVSVRAGGPLLVGSPVKGTEGVPIVWSTATPVEYRVDGGPMSQTPTGTEVISQAEGVLRVQDMFQVWEDVPTAAIRFANAGGINSIGAFSDGDVSTMAEFDAVEGDCADRNQSPIVFDADGSLFEDLVADSNVIGFAGPCREDSLTGATIVSGIAALNGIFQDGINNFSNDELTTDEFDTAFIHEFGHLIGLDHSQVNLDCGSLPPCSGARLDGVPTMFPRLVSVAMMTLAQDDVGWVSSLYPETVDDAANFQVPFNQAFGTITGTIFFPDGITHIQGVNVIARRVGEEDQTAVSVVSGFLFAGNVGQSVTCLETSQGTQCTNFPGSDLGSRDPLVMGTYAIPVTPGDYIVEIEGLDPEFVEGSGVGPISDVFPSGLSEQFPLPGPAEFYSGVETNSDDTTLSTPVTVFAGLPTPAIDIIINGTLPRFDQFESTAQLQRAFDGLQFLWVRRDREQLPQPGAAQ